MAKATRARSRRRAKERKKEQTAEAIRGRIEEDHRKAGLRREAEHLAADVEAIEEESATGEGKLSRQGRRGRERRRAKLERRALRLLERNDDEVRAVLERKGRLSGIMAADVRAVRPLGEAASE